MAQAQSAGVSKGQQLLNSISTLFNKGKKEELDDDEQVPYGTRDASFISGFSKSELSATLMDRAWSLQLPGLGGTKQAPMHRSSSSTGIPVGIHILHSSSRASSLSGSSYLASREVCRHTGLDDSPRSHSATVRLSSTGAFAQAAAAEAQQWGQVVSQATEEVAALQQQLADRELQLVEKDKQLVQQSQQVDHLQAQVQRLSNFLDSVMSEGGAAIAIDQVSAAVLAAAAVITSTRPQPMLCAMQLAPSGAVCQSAGSTNPPCTSSD
jgi:hypothetical protein